MHPYVTPDRPENVRVYDGPDPDTLHRAADRDGQAADEITETRR